MFHLTIDDCSPNNQAQLRTSRVAGCPQLQRLVRLQWQCVCLHSSGNFTITSFASLLLTTLLL